MRLKNVERANAFFRSAVALLALELRTNVENSRIRRNLTFDDLW